MSPDWSSAGERGRRGEGGSPAGRLSDPAGRKSSAHESHVGVPEVRVQPDQEERFGSDKTLILVSLNHKIKALKTWNRFVWISSLKQRVAMATG